MCGIAGLVGKPARSSDDLIGSMLSAMRHRGPDQSGVWHLKRTSSVVSFGHTRLSIIDVSESGRQPMVHTETGVALSYNGECYNFEALKEELEAEGYTFTSKSDTEVVLAAWVHWGKACVSRLRGMFAMAVWDPRSDSLFLVRDRVGVKPLYTYQSEGGLIFASELRAILATGVPPRIDPAGLESYIWNGFVPGPKTLIENIRLVNPATILEISPCGLIKSSDRYWQLPTSQQRGDAIQSEREAGEVLLEAVKLRQISDVPLGVFLSGGVDSSTVACLAQRTAANPVKTFNIRFEETLFDESPFARTIARAIGADHHEIPLTEQEFTSHLDDALSSIDQPTFDGLNTYFVSRAVREAGITVALSGAGGDEMFGGYRSFVDLPRAHLVARLGDAFPRSLTKPVARLISRILLSSESEVRPQTRWGKLEDMLDNGKDMIGAYQVSYELFTREFQQALRLDKQEYLRFGMHEERIEELSRHLGSEGALSTISRIELCNFIGERLLRDTDSTSMAVSLEARVPLLDHEFLEAVTRIPTHARFHPIQKKEFLKRLIAQEIPSSQFERKKAGFELPLELWCKRSLSDRLNDTFTDLNLAHSIGLDAEVVGRLWRAFKNDGAGLYLVPDLESICANGLVSQKRCHDLAKYLTV